MDWYRLAASRRSSGLSELSPSSPLASGLVIRRAHAVSMGLSAHFVHTESYASIDSYGLGVYTPVMHRQSAETAAPSAPRRAEHRQPRVRRDYRLPADLVDLAQQNSARTSRTETAVVERALRAYLATKGAWL